VGTGKRLVKVQEPEGLADRDPGSLSPNPSTRPRIRTMILGRVMEHPFNTSRDRTESFEWQSRKGASLLKNSLIAGNQA
jgi:hypothetical protein